MEQADVRTIVDIVPSLLRIRGEYWVDYDEGADVLYISFARPQKATETETLDDGILVRYRDKEIVGITVLNASKQPLLKRDKE